ncbi:hypothetical protein CYMTET_30872 [Cymbomonas tetramitiformis]|uniref:Uncharacterized protein n=1 Tax=Cymbomonas tetramitiformis TaxID=36881 RepID=A0AAE0FHY9_9CHLO|nr:hypothetical protein CYMTET_30872 [Cymbomonas tetramitiformis]
MTFDFPVYTRWLLWFLLFNEGKLGIVADAKHMFPGENHSSAILFRQAFLYTLRQIESAEVIAEPFPHLVVDDVFHPSLFAQLRAYTLPLKVADTEDPSSEAHTKPHSTEALRFSARFTARAPHLQPHGDIIDVDKLQASSRFWRNFAHAFFRNELVQAFSSKFDSLKRRFTFDTDVPSGFSWTGDLTVDRSGYSIGPHPDSLNKALTTIYYISGNKRTSSDLATQLYTPKESFPALKLQKLVNNTGHGSVHDFNRVDTVDFRPNRLLAFAPCISSWHGVERTQESRNTLQVFLRDTHKTVSPKLAC